MRVKATKDLEQAAALIEYLAEHDAQALNMAWVDLMGRGPGWRSRAIEGLQALQALHPDIDVRALELLPAPVKRRKAVSRPTL